MLLHITYTRRYSIILFIIILFILTTEAYSQSGASTVNVYWDESANGDLYNNTPSQIVPASYITFALDNNSFPGASSDNPVIIKVILPSSIVLSQTLATGNHYTTSPLPSNGEKVIDLAVGVYEYGGKYSKQNLSPAPKLSLDIGPHAVQLFRYVAGENFFEIRLNESTLNWPQVDTAYYFIGFTVGIPGGVWPESENTNWGVDGINKQQSTLYFMDVRNYPFSQFYNIINVSFLSFYQKDNSGTGTVFYPDGINIFKLNNFINENIPTTSQIGETITDFTVVDINQDGYDDIVTIDGDENMLYWAYGDGNGGFTDLTWVETVGIYPVTVDAADITGDAKPDILIGDESGALYIYRWEDLFGEQTQSLKTKVSEPAAVLKLPGLPSDSAVKDINNDSYSDYIYTDITANSLNVLFGGSFSQQESYSVGSSPSALAIGDFNNDHYPDIAVANKGSDNITVLKNNGDGTFSKTNITTSGQQPNDIATADFDRNGNTDIAVSFEGSKALGIFKASTNGDFNTSNSQMIYFLDTPSAIQADNFDGLYGPDVLVGFSDYYKLALCTSDENGNVNYAYHINSLGDVVIDQNNDVKLSEDNIVSVVSGTSYGGVSSRSGVTGILNQSFNVLHFPSSNNISFAVVNLGDDDSLINLELYDNGGNFKANTTETIPSKTQYASYFPSLLGSEASNDDRWVRAFLTQPETYGIWLMNNSSNLTYLDGTRIPDIRKGKLHFVFPVIYTGNGKFTKLYLINSSKSDAHLILKEYNNAGTLKEQKNVTMGGRARKVLSPSAYFSSISEDNYIEVLSDRRIIAFETYGTNETLACLDSMPYGKDQGTLYCPHVAEGNFGGVNYDSTLTLVNTSDTGASLSLTLYDDSGSYISGFPIFSLSAHAKRTHRISDLFNISGPTTGYIVIDCNGTNGIVGNISFGDADNGKILSSLPLQSTGHNDYIMGHLANGTIDNITYFTGFAILNPDSDSKVVQITAYDKRGVVQDSKKITIYGHNRSVFLLDQFMPSLQTIFGGYMIIDNKTISSGLLVFELFGDTNTELLSAVPAVPLD